MKPRLLLLTLCFTVFYLFTDLNWQVGNYLAGNTIYGFLRSKRGLLGESSGLIAFLLASVIGYLVFYILFYQKNRKILAPVVYLFIGVPLMIGVRYLIQEVIYFELFGYHNYSKTMLVPARYFMDNIYFAIYHSAFGIVFFFVQLSIYQQKRQNELVLQNRNAELSFLRSQINPHFLFNSLNNVYTLVYQQSANALPSISKLSELLRYMLYEKEDSVALLKEVQYLYNFIDLQRMRYSFEPALTMNIALSTDQSLKIAPLTLIPFVENAFKHGDLKDFGYPLIINLQVQNRTLHFEVINKISHYQKDETGGIGLDNVKKRLTLIYGDSHQININADDNLFLVKLTIDLHE